MKAEDLTKIIDMAIEAVDKSKFGPLFVKNEEGKTVCTNSAWDTYRIILSCICPKTMTGDMEIKEPREPWEKGE